MPTGAVIFDFNGTLSHDEPILCEIFCELFAEQGRPLSAQEYFDRLAGFSDPEIVRAWLGRDDPEVLAERISRYSERASDGSTVAAGVREAVRFAAASVPLAVVSGAAREEIRLVLAAAGLSECFRAIVAGEDVAAGKPDPEGYLRALTLLGVRDAVAIEDSEAGIAAAKAAGLRCVAVLGTLTPERLAGADEIVATIDVDLMLRLLAV